MNRKKEITKTIVSFKSKYQSPFIMIIKEYYETKKDKKNNNCYWAEVLFSTANIRYYLKNFLKKIKIIILVVMILFLTGCEGIDDNEIEQLEKQVKICRENGGTPKVYIRDGYSSSIPVVECNWECNCNNKKE